ALAVNEDPSHLRKVDGQWQKQDSKTGEWSNIDKNFEKQLNKIVSSTNKPKKKKNRKETNPNGNREKSAKAKQNEMLVTELEERMRLEDGEWKKIDPVTKETLPLSPKELQLLQTDGIVAMETNTLKEIDG
ncbi:unnamed protein product, partial [Owenia fusiformis]